MRLLCRKRVAAVLYIRKMTDAHQVSTINIERMPTEKGFLSCVRGLKKQTTTMFPWIYLSYV